MLLGINGFKQAGKDTFFQRLHSPFGLKQHETFLRGTKIERKAFADKLYESAAAALGVTVEQLYEWKEDPNIHLVVEDRRNPSKHIVDLSIREFLQKYGTEAHRNVFGMDFWVVQARGSETARALAYRDDMIVCVTDTRFENEAAFIRDHGGYVVKIVGPPKVEGSGDGHASEMPLPPELVDYVVRNDIRDDDFENLDAEIALLLTRINNQRRGF